MDLTTSRPTGPTNRGLAIAVAFCGLAVSWVAFEFIAAARLRETVRSEELTSGLARNRLEKLKARGQEELAQTVRLKQSLDLVSQPVPPPPAHSERLEQGIKFLAAHPEAKALLEQAKVAVANSWPVRRARAAGFSEEQVKEYAARFARQEGHGFWMTDIKLPDSGSPLSVDEVQETGLKALVGPELYAKYEAEDDSDRSQDLGASVAQMASDIGQPLSLEQSRALLKAFGTGQQTDWDAATIQAEKILSPAQLAAWNAEKAVRTDQAAEYAYRERAIDPALSHAP